MESFQTYETFRRHEHIFNVVFGTLVAVILSLLIGIPIAIFMDSSSLWFIVLLIILAGIPSIVYIALASEQEFHTAYYKIFCDKIIGFFDQKKLLQQFARQYHIKNWKVKLENLDADGRWHFKPDTKYIHELTNTRNLLLRDIQVDYKNLKLENDKKIIDLQHNLSVCIIELEKNKKQREIEMGILKMAKTPGEIFVQRDVLNKVNEQIKNNEMSIDFARSEISKAEKINDKLHEEFLIISQAIVSIFFERYKKYTEIVVRKINKVNNLKYSLTEMPNTNIKE